MQKTVSKPKAIIKTVNGKPVKKIDYSITYVLSELRDLQQILIDNEEIKSKAQLFKYKPYSNKKFSEWSNKFSTSKHVQERLKKIEEIIESRLIDHAMAGRSVIFCIFMLKNHYGYQDKRETSGEISHVFKVNRGLRLVQSAPEPLRKQVKNSSTIKTK